MKLVKLLAKELKEWTDCAGDVVGQARDGSLHLNGSYEENRGFTDEQYTLAKDWMSADVTKSQWQAEREKMNKPKWIRHRGGKCPVAGDVKVLYRMRSGTITSRGEPSSILSWDHSKSGADIMAYRVIEETKDQEIEEVIPKHMAFGYASKEEMVAQIGEECPFSQVASTAEKTNFGTITYKLEVDTSSAMIALNELSAKWDQLESPLKWRDEIIELEAYEEEFRREREKLIRNLESEGFKLIDHINCNLDKIDQTLDNSSGMSDWMNWRAGDTVECLVVPDKHTGYYFSGENYNIRCVDLDDEGTSSEVDIYCEEGFSLWCPSSSFKFVSRR